MVNTHSVVEINENGDSVVAYPKFQTRFNKELRDNTSNDFHEPTLDEYKQLLESISNDKKLFDSISEFEKSKINYQNLKFIDYIQYLSENGKIADNRKLFAHLLKTLDAMQFDGLITQRTQEIYKKQIKDSYYSKNKPLADNNKQNFHKKIDYSSYYDTTTRKVTNCELVNRIFDNGGEIYLDKKTKICLRLSEHAELLILSRKESEDILFSEFGIKVKITNDVVSYVDLDISDFIVPAKMIGESDEN
jgi:hypothetical protein